MEPEVAFEKVSLRPIVLLQEAYAMLGDQYWLFVGITLVGILVGSAVPFGILMGPMMCGIYLCYLQRERGERVEFGTLFKGFDSFAECLIAMLLMVAAVFAVLIPCYILFIIVMITVVASSQGGQPDPAAFGILFAIYPLVFALLILVSLPFLFVFPLIADRGLKAIPAIKTSFAAVWANLGGVLGMVIVFTFISTIATCMCYIPGILFMPVSFGGMFLAYRQIFPIQEATPL